VAQGLALVDVRLSGAGGTGLYDSVRNQLLWVQQAIASPDPPEPDRRDDLLLGVYAAREFETSDPELADILFAVQYLINRRWA
jgi:Tsi6